MIKITVLCHDNPYPPNHGGKIDMWNSLLALKKCGAEIQIVTWNYDDTTKDEKIKSLEIFPNQIHIKISRKFIFRLKKMVKLILYPWFSVVRMPDGLELNQITNKIIEYKPDVILLHGWHGALLAFHLIKKIGVPLFYRSQNVEYIYMHKQRIQAIGIRANIVGIISQLHIKNFEYKIMMKATKNYAISIEDYELFRNYFFINSDLIFPFFNVKSKHHINENPCYDLSFLGNLYSSNNVFGILWLLNEVMPIVYSKNPDITLLISGSNPDKRIIKTALKFKNVTIIKNPEDSDYVLSSGRVYINPTISSGGVQIKNVQMASHGRRMICLSQSLYGLPSEVQLLFRVARTAEEFANSILEETQKDLLNKNNFLLLNKYFGIESAIKIINDIKEVKPQ